VIPEYEQIALVRSPDGRLPAHAGEEHGVVGVTVYEARSHFALGFRTASGQTLRIRMPADQLAALGKVLLDLAEERRLYGDV
jgi:hypothetical protein